MSHLAEELAFERVAHRSRGTTKYNLPDGVPFHYTKVKSSSFNTVPPAPLDAYQPGDVFIQQVRGVTRCWVCGLNLRGIKIWVRAASGHDDPDNATQWPSGAHPLYLLYDPIKAVPNWVTRDAIQKRKRQAATS